MAMKMGEYLVSIGDLTDKQADEVARLQKEGDTRKFGEIAVSRGFIGDASIKRFSDYLAKG